MNSGLLVRRWVWPLALAAIGAALVSSSALSQRTGTARAAPGKDAPAEGEGVVCFGTVDLEQGVTALSPLQPGRVAEVLVHENETVSRGTELLRLEEGGAVLGVFAQWHYLQGEVRVGPGDRLVLFTDGVTEAENAAGEAFGEARLLEVLRANRGCSAQTLRDRIVETVRRFASHPFEDDLTVVVAAI